MRFLPKIILFCFLFFVCRSLSAQTNVFTYQGFLNLNGAPASGTNFNLSFAVYDASTNGNLLGACQATNVVINYGLFNVPVDVGPIFNGNQVWLEISVLSNSGPATVLIPRQPLTFTPRALYARTANNLIGSVSAAQISGTIGVGQLPGNVITNGETGIVVSGNFIGNGSGLTNIPGLLYQKNHSICMRSAIVLFTEPMRVIHQTAWLACCPRQTI